jgi:hypothetical protein
MEDHLDTFCVHLEENMSEKDLLDFSLWCASLVYSFNTLDECKKTIKYSIDLRKHDPAALNFHKDDLINITRFNDRCTDLLRSCNELKDKINEENKYIARCEEGLNKSNGLFVRAKELLYDKNQKSLNGGMAVANTGYAMCKYMQNAILSVPINIKKDIVPLTKLVASQTAFALQTNETELLYIYNLEKINEINKTITEERIKLESAFSIMSKIENLIG